MDEIVFVCLECGSCCKNLINRHDGTLRGLPLIEKEAKLFPTNIVSPRLAVGLKKPKHIITYQLNVNTCPHLDKKNHCAIYGKRPLVCKSFPVISGRINSGCKIFENVKENERIATSNIEPSVYADNEFALYTSSRFKKHFVRGIKEWRFDLEDRKWKVTGIHNEFPESEDRLI